MTNVCSLSLSPRAVMKSIRKSGCVLLAQGWQLRSHFILAHQMKRYKKTGLRVKGYSRDMRFDQNTMRYSVKVLRDTGFDQNTRRNSGNVLRDTGFHFYTRSAKLEHTMHDWEKNHFRESNDESSPGGLLGLLFAGYLPLASRNPYPTTICSVAIL